MSSSRFVGWGATACPQPEQLISAPAIAETTATTGTLALRLENSLRHVTNSFRFQRKCRHILNHQAHVEMETNPNCDSFRGWLQLNCASHIRYGGGDRLQFSYCPITTSGSFKPCPVTVQTIRLASRIFWNEYASPESHHLKRPAIDAALAGSTKIPSCCASHLCAARISSSLTTSIAP